MKKIRLKIILPMMTLTFITVFSLGGYVIYNVKTQAKLEISVFKRDLLEQRKQELKSISNVTYSALSSAYNNAHDQKKMKAKVAKRLTNSLNIVHKMVAQRYNDARKSKNSKAALKQARRELLSYLKTLRFGDHGEDYIWVHEYDSKKINSPKMIMHPIVPALDGKDISQFKYSNGTKTGQVVYATGLSEKVPFFIQMNRVVDKNNSGFVGYQWPQPTKGSLSRFEEKLSYVKVFKPFGWVLGTGAYLSNVESEVKHEVTQMIRSFRYGAGKNEYFWIQSYDKNDPSNVVMLMHPISSSLENKNVAKIKYSSGPKKGEVVYAVIDGKGEETKLPLFQQLNHVVSSTGEGFVKYQWPKPSKDGTAKFEDKISYIKLFKNWNWVIGTGVYLSDISQAVLERENAVEEQLNTIIKIFTGICILILFVVLIGVFALSQSITAPIYDMQGALKLITKGDLTKRVKVTTNDEIGELGKVFNRFIVKLADVISDVMKSSIKLKSASETLAESSTHMAKNSESMKSQTANIAESSDTIANSMNTVASAAEEASINVSAITSSVEKLSKNINNVSASAEEASANMSEINGNIDQISTSITEVAGSVESISASLAEVTDNTKIGIKISSAAQENSQELLKVIGQLDERASKIEGVAKLIGTIAAQTNMLALNATIEAASAGEAGKGFAVVAGEVKDLAQQTAEANNDIANNIKEISTLTASSFKHTESVNHVIENVVEINQKISVAMNEQSQNVIKTSQSIDGIASASKESALSVGEATIGLQEINKSVANALLSSKESVRAVTEASIGVTEIAKSSENVAQSLRDVNKNIQSIRTAMDEVSHSIDLNRDNSDELSSTAILMKELMTFFTILDNEADAFANDLKVEISQENQKRLM